MLLTKLSDNLLKKQVDDTMRTMITPEQSRAARALLDWTQGALAQATGLSAVTIRAFERGGEMRDSNRNLLRLSLETAGVIFVEENGEGPGVRLRKSIITSAKDGEVELTFVDPRPPKSRK
jgi:transcriptional regulator with XRE-family HTH domain